MKNIRYGVTSIAIYYAVFFAAIVITAVLRTSILYYRYLFVITGLFIFFISYFLGKEKNKYIIYSICLITLVLGIWSNYEQIKEAYDKSNMTQISYLQENIKPGDIIVFNESNFGEGTVVGLYFTENKQIYYNPTNWRVEEAYKAFGNQLKVYLDKSFVNECNGRVWIIDSEDENCYNDLFNNDGFEYISSKLVKTEYSSYIYNMILVQRVAE